MNTPFTATAVWLRKADKNHLELLVEIDGKWRIAVREYVPPFEGEMSHIAEGNGMDRWPVWEFGPAPGEGEGK